MRFRYPLQKIVDLKSIEKNHAEWMLSRALGILRNEQSALRELMEERNLVWEQLAESSARTTVSQMKLLQEYADHLDRRIRRKSAEVDKAKAEVAEKQNELAAKMKEEQVWTKVKEKAYEQFVMTVRKKEQDQLDEIALTRSVRTV